MFINKINNVSNQTFKGYRTVKNNYGETITRFTCPYDFDKENCEVQLFKATPTDKYNQKISETPIATIPLENGFVETNLQSVTNLGKEDDIAYKYVIKDKKTGSVLREVLDTGIQIKPENGEYVFRVNEHENSANFKYTFMPRKGTTPNGNGAAYLAVPDSLKPGAKFADFNSSNTGEVIIDETKQANAENEIKNFSNRFGGNIAGLIATIPYLKENGYKTIASLPIANGDDVSAHGYWNKNNNQIASTMGNMENFKTLFENLYANGMKYVYDGTFTSEGLEGIHFQYALRWADKNPQTYHWFRMSGLKNGNLGLGVVPNNKENLRHRVINAPVIFEQDESGKINIKDNPNYNPNKETLFQIYDAKQASERQVEDYDNIIRNYEKLTSGNELEINSHDDTLISFVFQVNPNEYKERLNVLKDLNKTQNIPVNSSDGTITLAQFSNFKIDKKTEGGFVTWDANTDMVKMNYHISGYDEKLNQGIVSRSERDRETMLQQRGAFEVQDMTIQTGRFWTKKVKDIQTNYTAKMIGSAKTAGAINKLIEDGKLPEEGKINDAIVNNILNGYYLLSPKGVEDKDSVTVRALMDLPLDSIEFGENTTGVLSTSYFSNRATSKETLGLTRFELLQQDNPHLVEPYEKVYNRVNDLFANEIKDFADKIIQELDKNSNEKLLKPNGEYTEYGEYIIELAGKDITRYAMLKSLSGKSFNTKMLADGTITYDYDAIRKNTTLKALGINANSPEEEARMLASKIEKGLRNLGSEDINLFVKSLQKRFEGTDTMSFRLAEAIVDRAGRGLDWRLDAAKDVIDQDAVRNNETSFDDAWDNMIQFWAKFVEGIKKENPYSYIVAEITDVPDLIKDTYGLESCPYDGRTNIGNQFNGEPDAMVKFYNQTGITTEAGYSYFFTDLLRAVSGDFENGGYSENNHYDFKNRLNLMMKTRSPEYIRNIFSFIGNHDKPRMLHGLALDMQLFHSNLQNNVNNFAEKRDHRLAAVQVLTGSRTVKEIPLELRLNVDNMEYFKTGISPRAIAMSKLLIDIANEDLKGIVSDSDIRELVYAFRDLANGNYLGHGYNVSLQRINIPEISSIENAFNEILKLAEAHGLVLSETQRSNLIKEISVLANNDALLSQYLVQGGFDWTEPPAVGNRNRELAELVLSGKVSLTEEEKSRAYSNTKGYEQYNLYTMSIAGLMRAAFMQSGSAKNASTRDAILKATKDFATKYNQDTVSKATVNSIPYREDFNNAMRKNAYAARSIETALDMAIKQVEKNTGKTLANKEQIIAKMYKSATEPAVAKAAILMNFLTALPGMPTMYAGDEMGMTGYEEKAKNIYLQNRNALPWSKIKGDSELAQYRRNVMQAMNGAMSAKSNKDLAVLTNGTPQFMETSDGVTSAIMFEDGDDAAISIFNAIGIDHRNRVDYFAKYGLTTEAKRRKFFADNNIDTININNKYVPIQPKLELDYLLLGAGVALPVGTIFMNSNLKDGAQYVVTKIGDKLGIVKKGGGKIVLDGKTAKNGAMILKKVKNIAFRGKQYNLASNPYQKTENAIEGQRLSIISR